MYFTYFKAVKHSWQLFIKGYQCAKMCSVRGNNTRKNISIEMYFKNKIKEEKLQNLGISKQTPPHTPPSPPKQTQGYKKL